MTDAPRGTTVLRTVTMVAACYTPYEGRENRLSQIMHVLQCRTLKLNKLASMRIKNKILISKNKIKDHHSSGSSLCIIRTA
jgi:hypothetical protein